MSTIEDDYALLVDLMGDMIILKVAHRLTVGSNFTLRETE